MGWLTGYQYRKQFTVTANGSIAGTITVVNGLNTVVGIGTAFTQWGVGAQIQLPDTNWYTIATITNDLNLTISIVYPGANASGQTYSMRLINYQMPLTIVQGAGTDSGATVYLGSRALTWPNDIRFTPSDGETLLDFWREESDATDGTWWIEFDIIPAGGATFYLYYGKASDTDASNAANTFITPYDGFERGNNGDAIGGSWTVESGAPIISTDHAYGGTRSVKLPGVNSVAAVARINCAASANVAIRIRLYKETLAANTPNLGQGNGTKFWNALIGWGGDTNGVYYYDTDARDTGVNITPDTWQLLEINNINFTAGTFDIWLNGSKIKTGAIMQTASSYNGQIRLANYDFHNGYDGWVDDFIVRNWSPTDPTFGTWGVLESMGRSHGYIIA